MKTMAIRLDDDLHAQLTVLAQLDETTITDIIRRSIENFVTAKREEPDIAARAEAVLAEIDQEAANRRDAISTLFAPEATDDEKAEPKTRSRRTTKD